MFRFHETSRKRIVRWAFVLLCAGPTLGAISWVAWRHRPGQVQDEAARLGGMLHVDVRLTDWREPRPDVTRTSAISLIEPGAGITLVAVKAAEIQHSANMVRIAAVEVALDAGHFDALLRCAHAWLAMPDAAAVRLEIDRLTIGSADGRSSFELRGVQIRVDRQATGAFKGQLTARMSADDDKAPELRMMLEQIPGEGGGQTRATVDARQVALPAWVVAITAPMFAACGADSTFSGVLQLESSGSNDQGMARGRIDAIALSSLLPTGSPHAAEGHASATITELCWRDRQIEVLSGSVRATDLTLSKSLIDAAVGSLFCGRARAESAPESVHVESLACQFQLNRKGLTLTGDLGPESHLPQGCLIAAGGRPLLMQPPYVDIPPGAWVQFLAGPASSWVPATQGAVEMAGKLPLPK
jgi:hypothetical protein